MKTENEALYQKLTELNSSYAKKKDEILSSIQVNKEELLNKEESMKSKHHRLKLVFQRYRHIRTAISALKVKLRDLKDASALRKNQRTQEFKKRMEGLKGKLLAEVLLNFY